MEQQKNQKIKRIEHDLLNKNKYAELYKVYHRLLEGIGYERGQKKELT